MVRDPMDDEESQMRGEGWKKEVTLKLVEIRGDVAYVVEYDFFADRIPCLIREKGFSGPVCGADHTWIRIIHGKLYWACARHSIVNGPISLEEGTKFKEYAVEAEKAIETCKDTGQAIPIPLKELYDQQKSRVRPYRRPKE